MAPAWQPLPRILTKALLASVLLAENFSLAGALETVPESNVSCQGSNTCHPGVLLPVWQPDNPSFGDKAARAIVYFVAMMYMFLGVSIIADRFMASIEVITSKEKEITVTKANGETSIGTVRIWNETVSNLTLMALGSSAPEILLSVIEVCGHNFQAGELGPGTIVGSAAFNMFVVIAICVYVIPAGESRKIKHLRVFFVTASWSIFAYIWLYLILAVISPGVVQIWEALLTLVFFPVCVVFAWIADKRLFFYKYVYKRYRADPRSGIIIGTEGEFPKDIEMDGSFLANDHRENVFMDGAASASPALASSAQEEKELDESRREVIQILKDLKQKHPDKELEQLVEMANYYALLHQQKSRAFYRIQATRMMTGAGNILKKHVSEFSKKSSNLLEVPSEVEEENYSKIFFEPCLYHCLENCGSVTLTVACQQGGEGNHTFYVDYKTEDGSAKAGSDYEYSEGTLIFKPGETQKELKIGIIDDDIFEEDEHFFVRLLNLRVGDAEGMFESDSADHPKGRLVAPLIATVTILDDDHAGIFSFQDKLLRVSECQGTMEVKVVRSSGARGTVMVPYRTVEGTARGAGIDYEDACGELEFKDDETVKSLQVKIVDDEEYEKKDNFFIELGQPRWLKRGISALLLTQADGDKKLSAEEEEAWRIAEMGKPILGENCRLEVIIEESYDFKNTVDKLIKKTNLALVIGTHSWREQFLDAITVSAGDEEEEEDGREEKLPSCFDYVMHFLTVFWKVLFACVPPTEYWNGWACFSVSILVIGLLTALIGDLASHFGCTVGLKDSVNAVVFVALGTSIPDTFASKVAALQDQCADASIGNVTGSNAVNVFLGLGVAWSVAAIYWAAQGQDFQVQTGTLAFSVTLFTIFAFICISVLMYRRRPSIGGELGGPRPAKLLTAGLFLGLWFLYILFSSLEAYCHIRGF
ncbi:sodium/calcium exchanger 2 [Gopherus evgoodei]|uniref:Calx-beta domain-containing protein n=1 Tax=Gopherus agassizii TaxID=38772 RepID=A0A452IFB0_9SAUR|nr:sodium/calcium exchanger 2 [Gopherus evgoodei]XP_030400363.1 sodium/calcium exchanger 2 [Gopherus evgoodei]